MLIAFGDEEGLLSRHPQMSRLMNISASSVPSRVWGWWLMSCKCFVIFQVHSLTLLVNMNDTELSLIPANIPKWISELLSSPQLIQYKGNRCSTASLLILLATFWQQKYFLQKIKIEPAPLMLTGSTGSIEKAWTEKQRIKGHPMVVLMHLIVSISNLVLIEEMNNTSWASRT